MTNIRDLAKMAGVSVTTVSRVLNNKQYVSEDKKKAVSEAIKEANYQQNINAVHLSKGKTNQIGVVVPYIDHPYFALLLKGIAGEAVKNNFKLVLFQTNYIESREIEALTMLKQKQIDSLIICSRICDWTIIEEFMAYGPVILCEDSRGKKVPSTYIDHYQCFLFALNYLHQKGHQRIGYCIGRISGTNSKYREKAYQDFLKDHQLPFNRDYIFKNCLHFEDGEKVLQQMKKMKQPPTALLVTSDQVAAGLVICAHHLNITIPGELAMIGFNNQPIAKMLNITTIEIPLVEMGRNLLLQAINEGETSHQEIPFQLIERETV